VTGLPKPVQGPQRLPVKQWGGLHFRLISSGLDFALSSDPVENPEFIASSATRDEIPVCLESWTERKTDSHPRPFFTSAEGWRMVLEDGVRIALNHPPRFSRPLWKAALDWPLEGLRIHLGHDMRTNEGWRDPFRYPLDLITTMYALASRQGLLVHGAGMVVEGQGYLFVGRSGAGKSTISDLLRQNLPGAQLLNDDRIIVRKQAEGWRLYGTPWSGRLETCHAGEAPLRGIFRLRHAPENRTTPMTPAESAETLLTVCSIPWYDRPVMDALLPLVEQLAKNHPLANLDFRPDPSVVARLFPR